MADWSGILTERGAIVDGGLHFPTAQELEGVDVIVSYKGDAGFMTMAEKSALETFLKRGGGLIAIHDTICADDPAWFSTIFGGAKKHGEVNFTLDADVPYTIVDSGNPIMQGISDFSLKDESFYSMTWAKNPEIHVLATAKIDATPSAVQCGPRRRIGAADLDVSADDVRRAGVPGLRLDAGAHVCEPDSPECAADAAARHRVGGETADRFVDDGPEGSRCAAFRGPQAQEPDGRSRQPGKLDTDGH